MKKTLALIFAALTTITSTSAFADGPRHDRRYDAHRPAYDGHINRGRADGPGWVVPLLIGGIIGYEISNTRPESGQVVVQAPPIPPGVVPQPVYVLQWVYYPDCNCYRQETIQTGWR
jgi:hypothetical protein